jgi:uncharacterized Zn-binding protein involved in type VI secretion
VPSAVRQGDPSSHGGVVLSGASKVTIVGAPAARVGDGHSCPLRGHGVKSIASGSGKVTIQGAPAARTGDATGCGASLVAGQSKVSIG